MFLDKNDYNIFIHILKASPKSMSIFTPNIVLPVVLSFLWVMANLYCVFRAFRDSVAKERNARNVENSENIENIENVENVGNVQNKRLVVDEMADEDIHDLLVDMSKRFLIPTWYDRSHLSTILNRTISDSDWDSMICFQGEMAKSINDITREWSENMLEEISRSKV